MTDIDRDQLYKRAIKQWGCEPQLRMAQEEAAELIVAVNHLLRGRGSRDGALNALAEEVADMEIMLGQLRRIADLGSRVDFLRSEKLRRLNERLERAEKKGLGNGG